MCGRKICLIVKHDNPDMVIKSLIEKIKEQFKSQLQFLLDARSENIISFRIDDETNKVVHMCSRSILYQQAADGIVPMFD